MQSFKKKIVSLIDNGIDPVIEGKRNFDKLNKEVERLAIERLATCKGCPFFIDEPINFLQVIDKRIPKLSKKMCDECGCTLSYKLRQSKKMCSKWLK